MSQLILHSYDTQHQSPDNRHEDRPAQLWHTWLSKLSPISPAHFNVPLNTVYCQHTSIVVNLLQLSTTAPSSPSKQAGDSDVRLSRWIKVIQSEPPPHPLTPPIVSWTCHDPRAFRFSSQTCLFLSQQWKLAWCRTPMHTASLQGLFVCLCMCVSCDWVLRLCGLEWQCHLLITGPTLCWLRGFGGYYFVFWQVPPLHRWSKQTF